MYEHVGLPSQEDLLILTLGLGGSGNNYKAFNQPINSGIFQVSSLDLLPAGDRPDSKCPQFGTNCRICRNIPGELATYNEKVRLCSYS